MVMNYIILHILLFIFHSDLQLEEMFLGDIGIAEEIPIRRQPTDTSHQREMFHQTGIVDHQKRVPYTQKQTHIVPEMMRLQR